MKTRVVHINKEPYDVYIGRKNEGKKLEQSPFANPFKIGRDGNRKEVVEKFHKWFLEQPGLVERAKKELKGKVLGCWCKPKLCHGDVIIETIEGERE